MRLPALLAGLLLAACSGEPAPPPEAGPALWRVETSSGRTGWLFGTIHSMPEGTAWRSAAFARAFAEADTLVVELTGLEDQAAANAVFMELARTPGQGELSTRVTEDERWRVELALDMAGLDDGGFSGMETWAAALTLGQALRSGGMGPGADQQLLAAAGNRPVVELEGLRDQLAIFDGLPEAEQADLLLAVAREAGHSQDEPRRLFAIWAAGDVEALVRETRAGLLADPELRQALLVARNEAWAERIAALLDEGSRPFVAVGAAHIVGEDGLAAMLAAEGARVTRVE